MMQIKILVIHRLFDNNKIMEENQIIRCLAALAQPVRLRTFRLLVVAGPQGMTPSAIAEALEVPPATLSFHLKELLNAGLLTQERESRNLIYRAQFERMNALLGYLTDNCCRGETCMPTATGCSTC